MNKSDVILVLQDESDTGFTKRKVLLPIAEITALEEETVPTKGKRRTIVHTNHGYFKSLKDIDTLFNAIVEALTNGDKKNED